MYPGKDEYITCLDMTHIKFFNRAPWLLCNPLHLFFVYTLQAMGYTVEVVDCVLPGDPSLYFITFAHHSNLPANYILYNFEYGGAHLCSPHNIRMYNGAIEVWDYSTRNIAKMGLRTVHKFVPYLPGDYPDIVEKMRTYISNTKDYTYLFYGLMNNRRMQVLDELSKSGTEIHQVGHGCRNKMVAGEDLFRLLGRTKCVVNIHYYSDPVLEIYRITECLLLGVDVVSEDGFVDEVYRSRLTNLTIRTPLTLDLVAPERTEI